jgi:hypothetical protein
MKKTFLMLFAFILLGCADQALETKKAGTDKTSSTSGSSGSNEGPQDESAPTGEGNSTTPKPIKAMPIPMFVGNGVENPDHFVSQTDQNDLRYYPFDCFDTGSSPGERLKFPSTSCGLSGTVNQRISDCVSKNALNATVSTCGAIWKLVTLSTAGEVWLDETEGLIWSDIMKNASNNVDFTWCRASGTNNAAGVEFSSQDPSGHCNQGSKSQDYPKPMSICFEHPDYNTLTNGKGNLTGVTWYLPTLKELARASEHGLRKVVPRTNLGMYVSRGFSPWSSSVNSGNISEAWAFNNSDAFFLYCHRASNYIHNVRCVATMPK